MRLTDHALTTISLTISLLGVAGLIIVSAGTETRMELGGALISPDETTVTLHATITNAEERGNTTLLRIEERCELQGVIFSPMTIEVPMEAVITGTMSTYNGERELLVERIEHP